MSAFHFNSIPSCFTKAFSQKNVCHWKWLLSIKYPGTYALLVLRLSFGQNVNAQNTTNPGISLCAERDRERETKIQHRLKRFVLQHEWNRSTVLQCNTINAPFIQGPPRDCTNMNAIPLVMGALQCFKSVHSDASRSLQSHEVCQQKRIPRQQMVYPWEWKGEATKIYCLKVDQQYQGDRKKVLLKKLYGGNPPSCPFCSVLLVFRLSLTLSEVKWPENLASFPGAEKKKRFPC